MFLLKMMELRTEKSNLDSIGLVGWADLDFTEGLRATAATTFSIMPFTSGNVVGTTPSHHGATAAVAGATVAASSNGAAAAASSGAAAAAAAAAVQHRGVQRSISASSSSSKTARRGSAGAQMMMANAAAAASATKGRSGQGRRPDLPPSLPPFIHVASLQELSLGEK